MTTHTVRLPEATYDAVRVRAEAERRSIANMTDVLLTMALAGNLRMSTESWPVAAEAALPVSEAEVEWATQDPVEPEPEPEPVFVPVTRSDEVTPDFGTKVKVAKDGIAKERGRRG